MAHTFAGQLSDLLCLVVCAYALVRGGAPERTAAVGYLLCSLGTNLIQDRVLWLDPQRRLLIPDGAALLLFAVLASTTRRTWLIVATAAQLLSASTHLALLYSRHRVAPFAYLTVIAGMSYVVLLALLWGTWLAGKTQRAPSPSPTG